MTSHLSSVRKFSQFLEFPLWTFVESSVCHWDLGERSRWCFMPFPGKEFCTTPTLAWKIAHIVWIYKNIEFLLCIVGKVLLAFFLAKYLISEVHDFDKKSENSQKYGEWTFKVTFPHLSSLLLKTVSIASVSGEHCLTLTTIFLLGWCKGQD